MVVVVGCREGELGKRNQSNLSQSCANFQWHSPYGMLRVKGAGRSSEDRRRALKRERVEMNGASKGSHKSGGYIITK